MTKNEKLSYTDRLILAWFLFLFVLSAMINEVRSWIGKEK